MLQQRIKVMVLLIDNYDSFTYNLYDYILQLGFPCKVIRNDECTMEEIKLMDFDQVIISPGPGIPKDAGRCNDLIDFYHDKLPILGICLGFQAIGEYFGAKLIHAKLPMHGKTSSIEVDSSSALFQGIETPTQVMRYHSLILDDVPEILRITGQSKDGEVMAFEHQKLAIAGVQFHPESILTPSGLRMIENFLKA